jgi:hypothetical protein
MDYGEIAGILGIDVEKDREAARILDKLVGDSDKKFSLKIIGKLIKGRPVIVFGAGPSLGKDVGRIKAEGLFGRCTLIAADGAAKALLERNIIPDINVTDLDGDMDAVFKANESGTVTLVHAHGDNLKRIRKYFPEFKGIVFGTTQIPGNVETFKNIYNFGGFTDGDRCVFLAKYFNAKVIALAGMDFGSVIGEYSGTYSLGFKLKKMEVAKKLLAEISSENKIFNLTCGGEDLMNIPGITVQEFGKMT